MDPLPDPAVLVLIGAAGSGKSTWAAQHYSRPEIVSSDALRGIVGSGPADLDATTEAFSLLDQIIAGRTRRRLTTVIDTLGLDRDRRLGYLAAARAAQLPAVAVLISVDEGLCRERNARRDRPVPAPALARQLRSMREIGEMLAAEGWDRIVGEQAPDRLSSTGVQPTPVQPNPAIRPDGGPELILQLSRFPWGEDPLAWLTAITRRADEIGLAGIALMDHLIQIPQVGRSWEPIPEPWVTTTSPRDRNATRHRIEARHPGQPGDLSRGRHHGQGGGDPRRTLRWARVPRARRRLVGTRARRVRPAVPAGPRAA